MLDPMEGIPAMVRMAVGDATVESAVSPPEEAVTVPNLCSYKAKCEFGRGCWMTMHTGELRDAGQGKPTTVWLQRLEWGILVFACAYLCLHVLPRAWTTLNTDFPNYYLAAKLARQGVDASRMYEWTWIQRQKDLSGIDVRVIGLLPITSFSTLFVFPLTYFAALGAKHIWILGNLILLLPLGWLLQQLTCLGWRRISIILLLSFPLARNLLYGQFYIVLLVLIIAACYAYVCGKSNVAAALVAVAGACKIFPLLLFAFFLIRREWRALVVGAISFAGCVGLAVTVFGQEANRTWLNEILPWVTRGEGLGTYSVTASITAIAHGLFLYEPQWNPSPWHSSFVAYAVVVAVGNALLLSPALLLIDSKDSSPERVMLEWSSLVVTALAISTIPASYNFVLIALPVCAVCAVLLRQRRYAWIGVIALCYLSIGYPLPTPEHIDGLRRLIYAPRIAAMGILLATLYRLQFLRGQRKTRRFDCIQCSVAIVVCAWFCLSARSMFKVQDQQRTEYTHRLPISEQGYANTMPQVDGANLYFIRFGMEGYQLVSRARQDGHVRFVSNSENDTLSFVAKNGTLLAEQVRGNAASVQRNSQIVDMLHDNTIVVDDARDPMLSASGRDLGFVRDEHGRGRLYIRKEFQVSQRETLLTPKAWNVYEASMLADDNFAVVAAVKNGAPQIYRSDSSHHLAAVTPQDSRYPAFSPNGAWLAYTHREHGFWNLWLRDERTGISRRVADLPCNQVQPSWEGDSKTVVYSTDCGRSIWFGAIARQQVVP